MRNYLLILDFYNNGFYFLSLFAVSVFAALCGIYVIISKNPITSILYLIGLFVAISIYLILLGVHFIGLSYLLVYVGAVSILFLFILMLINIRISEIISTTGNNFPLAFIVGSIFLPVTYKALPYTNINNSTNNNKKNIVNKTNSNTDSVPQLLENNTISISEDLSESLNNTITEPSEEGIPVSSENIITDLLDINLTELSQNSSPIFQKIYFSEIYSIFSLRNLISKISAINEYLISHDLWENILADISHINGLGNILYTNYFIWLLLSSMILLLALVGCVVITKKNEK